MYISQAEAEKSEAVIDAAAHPSAKALGCLLTLGSGYGDEETLYRFGYSIGRWVYLVDAADDYEDDLKSGGFNPFKKYGKEDFIEKAKFSLNLTSGEAVSLFEKLKINHYKSIIKNILYDGMYYSAKRVFADKEDKNNA